MAGRDGWPSASGPDTAWRGGRDARVLLEPPAPGFYDLAKAGVAPVAAEALARIAALYRIKAEVRGKIAAERPAVRRAKSQPAA